jgi:hypothetical protein
MRVSTADIRKSIGCLTSTLPSSCSVKIKLRLAGAMLVTMV